MSNKDGFEDISQEDNLGGSNSEFKETTLGNIPADWEGNKLGNDFDIEYGAGKKEKDFVENGDFPVFGANGIIGRSDEFLYERPVVTVTCRGATCGNVNLTEAKSWVTNNSLVLENGENVNPIFLAEALRQHSVSRSITGTAQPQITSTLLSKVDYIRAPLYEQRRIASVLYNVDQAIQKTEDIIEQTRRVKKGLMQDLFTEGYYNHEENRETKIGLLPAGWKFDQLKEHTVEKAFGPRFSSDRYKKDGDIATVRTTDLDKNGNIDKLSMPLADLDLDKIDDHILEKGDLIITRSGTTGIASVWDGFGKKTIPGAFLIRFRLKETLDPNYLKQYINSSIGGSRVNRRARGGVQKNLSGRDLMNMKFPIPSLEEQRKIVQVLSEYDRQINHFKNEKEYLKRVKKGLMQDLLTGKVRTKDKNIEVLDEVLEVEKS